MKYIVLLVGLFMATTASAQQTTDAAAGVVRVLDKVTGAVTDLRLATGETAALGYLKVTLNECRYLTSNPNGDAFTKLTANARFRGLDDRLGTGAERDGASALRCLGVALYHLVIR